MPRLIGISSANGISVGALRSVIERLPDSKTIKIVIVDDNGAPQSNGLPILVRDDDDAVTIEVVMRTDVQVSDRETRKRARETALDELAAMTQDMDGYPELK